MSLFQYVPLLLSASLASAACTRPALQSTLDNFFTTAFAMSANQNPSSTSPEYSSSIRISQNNEILKSLSLSAYTNITSFYKPFHVTAIDTAICSIATFVLVNQKDNTAKNVPAMMSVRIKTEDDAKTIQELEILNVLKGSHAFFAPGTFPNDAPAVWSAPQTGSISRAELLKIANLYPSGIQAGDGSAVPVGSSCPRIENGIQTATLCNSGLNRFKQPVRARRWLADEVTGVVLGEFYFDKVKQFNYTYGLWLNEYFKIENGKLSGIQAVMKELGGVPFVDVWGAP